MKIAHVSTVFPPYKGGMGQVPYHFARELKKLEHDVTVLTPDYGKQETCPFPVVYFKPWFSWGLAALCPQVLWKLREYDVVHLHYPAFGMALFVLLWKKLFGRNKQLHVYYHMDSVGSGWLGVIFKLYTVLFRKILLQAADGIQVSTQDYAEHSGIASYYRLHKETFTQVPFGATEVFVPGNKNTQLLKKHGIDPDKKIILFVGALGKSAYFKGVSILLQAVQRLNGIDWQLVLVGKGDMILQYQEQAKSLGIAQHVFFVGWQPDELLPEWYKSAYVFCMPSTDASESFGIVYIEAMACGVPVIASSLPGVREVVIDTKTGFIVTPNNPVEVADKIAQLLSNNDVHERFSQAAAELVNDKYRWPKAAKTLETVYQK